MNQEFEKFIENSRLVVLKPEDRRQIRQNLVSFMTDQRQISKRSVTDLLLIKVIKPMPIALLIVLLLGGGVSAAAEQSLPGDVLHPIKVEVNERVRGALAFSADSKASWEVRLAERRLEEAEKLSAQPDVEVKADVLARIEVNFNRHADRVKARVAELEAAGKTEAAANFSSKFEASLRAHEDILERLRVRFENGELTRDEVKDELKNLREEVKERREAIKEVRKEHEDKVIRGTDAKPAAEAAAKMSANVIAEVKRLVANAEAKLGAEAVAVASAKLAEAERVHAAAQAKLEAGSFREAFLGFHESARIAQHAKRLVRAHAELRLDIRKETDADEHKEDNDVNEVEVESHGRLELKLR